ncbi:MAG: hypothetical protein IAE94_06540 [Chthoniobacterales bacterium]|nr:hypothetical protein [Chthoniobacterales bacterium]
MKVAIAANSIGYTAGGVSAASRGLGRILLSRAALVTIAGLLIYSGSELAFDPPRDFFNFIAHHFVHVAVIGLGAWLACWLALRKNVLIPVEAIARYLSRFRHGRIERLVCETKATEIEAIITGINQLAERLKATSPDDLNAALTAVQELRVHLNRVSATDPETKVPVMRALTRLESSLLLLLCKEPPTKE